MLYCAIIGDIVDSRKINNRYEVQEKFRTVLDSINANFVDSIASNFTITLGDEFQGLLTKPYMSYEIVEQIKLQMKPIALVFGIGVGEINTKIDRSISIGADGPAYYYARDMIMRAKKKEPSICYYSNSNHDELINSLLFFIQSCYKKRTKRQSEVIEAYEKNQNQRSIAKELNLASQSTISEILNKAYYYEIRTAETKIKEFLDSIYTS